MNKTSILLLLIGGILWAGSPAVEPIGEPILLVDQDIYLMNPSWSPDGASLAITGANYTGIYIYSFNGNDVVQLSDKLGAGFGMSWSHDGKSIVTRISKYENKRRWSSLAVYSIDDGQEELITGFVKRLPGRPAWTENDDRIYMSSTQAMLYLVPGKSVSANRSGEMIIYSNKNKLFKRDLVSDTVTELIEAGNEILTEEIAPDGKKLVYQVYGGNLWVLNIENGERTDLGIGEHPTWGADSRKLAYMITADDGYQLIGSDIFVINIDGTGKVNLTDSPNTYEMHPDWSPNGKWIAYDTNEAGKIWMQEVQ